MDYKLKFFFHQLPVILNHFKIRHNSQYPYGLCQVFWYFHASQVQLSQFYSQLEEWLQNLTSDLFILFLLDSNSDFSIMVQSPDSFRQELEFIFSILSYILKSIRIHAYKNNICDKSFLFHKIVWAEIFIFKCCADMVK